MTKSSGDFDTYGTILDESTGTPISGVNVYLTYYANSFWGDHSKVSTNVISNLEGKFYIPENKVRLWGGTGGGLDGSVSKWPLIWCEKDGYLTTGKGSYGDNPSKSDYQNVTIKMRKK